MANLRGVRVSISVECFQDESLAESDADMPLQTCLSRTWAHIQGNFCPWLTEELGPLTDMHKQVVTALEVAGVEAFVQVWPGLPGRPPCDRAALARAFIAKEHQAINNPSRVMTFEGWYNPMP